MNLNKKYAMPWLKLKDKGSVDLFFEFIHPNDRKRFFEDLISNEKIKIDVPNFGIIKDLNINIKNEIKQISKEDLDEFSISNLEKFLSDKKIPPRLLIRYNKTEHKFELKPKHDFEKILKEVTENNSLTSC